ncbi:MAG: PH domain-containing protein [Brumimicrobium sp.]
MDDYLSLDVPQRQSVKGIVLILAKLIVQTFKRFWPLLIILFNREITIQRLTTTLIIILVFLLIALIYSIFYYRNFLFYIDYDSHRFILQKGVFSSKIVDVPFSKIQQVDLKRSIFQRIINVYSVVIDTAGSKKNEVLIHAIPYEKARNLSDTLSREAKKAVDSEENEGVVQKDKVWTHHLSIFDLLKIGITESYFRGFLLILAFVATTYSQLNDYFENIVDDYIVSNMEYIEDVSSDFLYIVSFIVVVFVLSIFVTVARTILKHFNLTIRQTPKRLEVEMGLNTNTKVSFQAKRLQYFKIETNRIQKKFNLYQAQMSLAGSTDEIDKSKIIVPGLTKTLIESILEFLYHKDLSKNIRSYFPHKVWLNKRILITFLVLIAFWLFSYRMGGFLQNLNYLIVVSILFLVFIIPYQVLVFRSIKYNVSDEFLHIEGGLWTQKKEIIELFKLQGVTSVQPLWYKRRDVFNVTFHTAGGDVKLRAVPSSFLKEINYILYKVESGTEPWM